MSDDDQEYEVVEQNNDPMPDNLSERVANNVKSVKALAEMKEKVLDYGVDYDKQPGIPRPFLHKPGAERLCAIYNFDPDVEIVNQTIELEHDEFPLIDYDVKCVLYERGSGIRVGSGVGNANSWEKKYRYDSDGNQQPRNQATSQKNTILKMAKKRAFIDAVLTATGASRMFTQDDDYADQWNDDVDESELEHDPNEELGFSQDHSEKPWKEVPVDFLEWLSEQDGENAIRAKKELDRREDEDDHIIPATDAARELAKEHDIDLSECERSGENNNVLKSDVQDLIDDGDSSDDNDDTESKKELYEEMLELCDILEIEQDRLDATLKNGGYSPDQVKEHLENIEDGEIDLTYDDDGLIDVIPF